MPSFTLPDPYEGWSVKQLKQRCRDLCRAVDTYQHMAMAMSEVPGSLDKLDPEDRKTVERLVEAYKD